MDAFGVAEFLYSVCSNLFAICNSCAAICNANFDWGSDRQISPSYRGPDPQSNTVLLGTTRVSLPNGISFR